MKYGTYNYGIDVECSCNSIRQTKSCIKRFLLSILDAVGLKRGYDYYVTNEYLFIRHIKTVVGRVMISLKETFPVFNFYWKTPRKLVWL